MAASLAAFALEAVIAPAGAPAHADTTTGSQPSDGVLEERVQQRIAAAPELRGEQVDVEVSQGVATLKGSVANEADKILVERLARAEGVASVTNQLEVAPVKAQAREAGRTIERSASRAGKRLEQSAGSAGEAISDGWITAKVKSQLAAEKSIKASQIDVDTRDKVVTLRGTVPSDSARQRALDLARTTRGTVRVIDELHIGTPPATR